MTYSNGRSYSQNAKNVRDLVNKFNRHARAAKSLASEIQAAKRSKRDHRDYYNNDQKRYSSGSESERREVDAQKCFKKDAERNNQRKAKKFKDDEFRRKDDVCKKADQEREREDDKKAFAQNDRKVCKLKDKDEKKRKRFHVRKFFEKKWEEDVKNSEDEREVLKNENKRGKKAHRENNDQKGCRVAKRDHIQNDREGKAYCAQKDKAGVENRGLKRFHSDQERSDSEKDLKKYRANYANLDHKDQEKCYDKDSHEKAYKRRGDEGYRRNRDKHFNHRKAREDYKRPRRSSYSDSWSHGGSYFS